MCKKQLSRAPEYLPKRDSIQFSEETNLQCKWKKQKLEKVREREKKQKH